MVAAPSPPCRRGARGVPRTLGCARRVTEPDRKNQYVVYKTTEWVDVIAIT